jgi:GxxExxY protein
MKFVVEYNPEFFNDLVYVVDWYNDRQTDLGKKFFNKVKQQTAKLSTSALLFAVKYDDIRCMHIEKFPYLVHYRINEQTSTVKVEALYQRCLAIEMTQQGIAFSREHEMDLTYKGNSVGTRRVNFFVEGEVMVELKAVSNLDDVHLAQAINYLEAYGLNVGLLINFGNTTLQFKRVSKSNKQNHSPSQNQIKS